MKFTTQMATDFFENPITEYIKFDLVPSYGFSVIDTNEISGYQYIRHLEDEKSLELVLLSQEEDSSNLYFNIFKDDDEFYLVYNIYKKNIKDITGFYSFENMDLVFERIYDIAGGENNLKALLK